MIAHGVAEQLRLVDRAVVALTRSTEALIRASDEASLLRDICHIAVDVAGYALAWIGYPQHDPMRTVLPMAHAGPMASYLRDVRLTWDDSELGKGPTGATIRTGITQVVRDMAADPRLAAWRNAARAHGLRSSIALPLENAEGRLGELTLYAQEPDAFDSEVIRLLEDMARNLGYGIGALRMKAEHDRAVKELAESEERYRSLIELSPDAVLVHAQGTVLFANPASASIFGAHSPATLVGRPLLDLIHPDWRSRAEARVANPTQQDRLLQDFRLIKMDGSGFDAELAGASITFHGKPARLIVLRDMTERRQIQEQLIQAAKLATLGEMAAGLVHELSQPLNIIRLTSEGALLFIERGKATQEWQAQQFQLVADQAQRTAEIIDDIRIFSRRDRSPEQVFDAVAAIRAAIGVLAGQMRDDDIAMVVDLPDHPVPVRGRRVQVEQVVMNLLSNSQHALKEKREQSPGREWRGEIRISAAVNAAELKVVVSDDGPGLAPEIRKKVFEPFFTTKEAGRGTGLGLSVSFGIINSMSGRLETMDQTVGACFLITLPVANDACGQPDAAPIPPAATVADAHIMVVDDERTAGDALANYLAELGYRVTTCRNGTEAWQRFQSDPVDVLITDLRMPSGSGQQLIERVRDYDPLLPVIIVTGHLGATERLSEDLNDDRCAVLKKPAALHTLGELVANFLQPPL